MNALWVDFEKAVFFSHKNEISDDYFFEIVNFLTQIRNKEDIVCYTSGSTSSPKEINISFQRATKAARLSNQYFEISSDSVYILPLHIKHIGAKMLLIRAYVQKAKVLILEPGKSLIIPEKYNELSFSFISVSPIQLISTIDESPHFFDRVEKCLIGGSPVTPFIEKKIKSLNTNCEFYESFGMTETISHFALRNISNNEQSFQCLDGYQVEKKEDTTLVVYHTSILPEKIYTNDVIEVTSNNRFIWKGRVDNIINTSGIKVNPEALENIISRYIQDKFIISSLPDDVLGEKIILIINAKPSDYLYLKNSLKSNPAIPPKLIPKEVFCIDKWSETANFKPIRSEIKANLSL